MNNLAVVLFDLNKLEDAEFILSEILEINK